MSRDHGAGKPAGTARPVFPCPDGSRKRGRDDEDQFAAGTADFAVVFDFADGLRRGALRPAEGGGQPGAFGGNGVSGVALRGAQGFSDRRFARAAHRAAVRLCHCGAAAPAVSGPDGGAETAAASGRDRGGYPDLQQRGGAGYSAGAGPSGGGVRGVLLRLRHRAADSAVDPLQHQPAGRRGH